MVRYIFSINTGRSGSHYLSKILAEVENVSSLHEPDPIMNGYPMKEYMNGNPLVLQSMMKEKLDSIANHKGENLIYSETNHCFIKGFGWLIPQYIPQEEIGIVVLKRDKKDIVKSYKKINCTPFNHSGLQWLISPLKKKPLQKISSFDKFLYKALMSPIHYSLLRILRSRYNLLRPWTDQMEFFKKKELELLDWYVEETLALGEKFKKEFPNIKFFETSAEKLNDENEFKKMFSFFGIPFHPKKSFFEKLGRKTNLNPSVPDENDSVSAGVNNSTQ